MNYKRIAFLLPIILLTGCLPIAFLNTIPYIHVGIQGKNPFSPIVTMSGPYVRDGENMVKLEQFDVIGWNEDRECIDVIWSIKRNEDNDDSLENEVEYGEEIDGFTTMVKASPLIVNKDYEIVILTDNGHGCLNFTIQQDGDRFVLTNSDFNLNWNCATPPNCPQNDPDE